MAYNRRYSDSNIPWWLNAIYKVGVPSAIALFLVWFLVSQVKAGLESIQNTVNQHVMDNKQLLEQDKKLYNLLQQMCSNQAKDYNERSSCFQ